MLQATPRQSALLVLAASMRMSAGNPDNTPVHRAADAHHKQMLLVVMAAFMRGKKAYKSGGTDAAVKAIKSSLLSTLPGPLAACLEAGGQVGLESIKKLKKSKPRAAQAGLRGLDDPFQLRFDVSNPDAVEWAKEHAAELAEGISETSRERIRNAVASALDGDEDNEDLYDEILDAVGDEDRAEVIARTEVMTAANEGQRQSWDQAAEAGLLDGNETVEWIATSDCCDECADLDGETRTLDGNYPGDGQDGPPLHPNCRCTEGIVAASEDEE